MARTYVYLFGLGATVALVTLLLAGDPSRNEIGIALAALAAYGATATCLLGYDRLPNWVFESMPPVGTVCATGVVLSGGAAAATAYAGFYFWVVFAAFSFLTLRAAIVNLAFVAISYGLALGYLDATYPGLRWLMALATLTVAGLLLIALRGRVDGLLVSLRRQVAQQDAIALIGKRSLTAGDFGELMESTAAKVAEVLGVERAAVLGLPDGKSLMYRTGVGWDRDAARSANVPLDDPLAGPALIARGPVLYESEEEPLAGIEPAADEPERGKQLYRGAAAAIRGHDDTLGVLVAYGTPRHRFTESDGRFLQAAANVIAEAIRRREVEEEARRQILYDTVTERPNRALFMDRLGEAVLRADRDGTTLAVYIVEIEEFKIINDSYGDLFGNALLRAFASRLRRPLYLADTVARMGGPEFAVLCEGLEEERGAIEIAEQLGASVRQPFEIGGERIRVSAATGVALSEPSATAKDLVARADAALYKARSRELGTYELFDDELRQRLRYRVSLSHALAEAPERGELSFDVQPIVSIVDGRVRASECLLRWDNAERGRVPPLEFIPVAEQTGSILVVGAWVVREAARMAAAMRERYADAAPLPLHVNISPRQLAQADFVAQLGAALEGAGARPDDIALEITEKALLTDEDRAARVLDEARDLGVKIVLDDFGTGYSSLSHLNRFPLDAIKVDRHFVGRIQDDPGHAAIVAAVVKMGQALGIEVIAEGVETLDQSERLKVLGCRFAQGQLYGRPEPYEGGGSGAGSADDAASIASDSSS